MPDWSYHPLLRPATAWLSAKIRRDLALRGLQTVASVPVGWLLIDFLGRMKPDTSLATALAGKTLISPMGLGGGVDPDAVAIGGLGRFGVGFVEVGPYTLGAASAFRVVGEPLNQGGEPGELPRRLSRRPTNISVWMRLVVVADDPDAIAAIDHLLARADAVEVVSITLLDRSGHPATGGPELWRSLLDVCRHRGVNTVLADVALGDPSAAMQPLLNDGISGFVLRSIPSAPLGIHASEALSSLRQRYPKVLLVAACGATSPREILDQFDAGAQLVAVDAGMIEAGPLLAKRANEALAGSRAQREAITAPKPDPGAGWWALLLGVGMFIAGAVVLWVGLTRVVLPYDEAFLGISRDAFSSINPRLLAFMQHDRVTLAGTLMSIGILYASLALNGLRNGWRWARDALLASGAVGFATLFLFLGFHYIDPLHVTLSATLFPLFLLGVLFPTRPQAHPSLDLDNDSVWRLGLMGQLLFIGLAAGLIVAGLTIMSVGVTRVFVFSDLEFLRTTSSAINGANAHLLPLIAHDRAGFGGALASDGVAVLLMALWGFRRGERWVWWTLLLAGLVGLAGGIYAHVSVGYLEFGHLLPLFVSAAVFATALAFSFAFLLRRPPLGV